MMMAVEEEVWTARNQARMNYLYKLLTVDGPFVFWFLMLFHHSPKDCILKLF